MGGHVPNVVGAVPPWYEGGGGHMTNGGHVTNGRARD